MSLSKQFESSSTFEKERDYEAKESKEAGELDPELQAAVTRERAEYLKKEMKSNTQQVQNIVIHMQQVQQAIQKIRSLLQLTQNGDDSSVVHDKKLIEKLQKQIGVHKKELLAMKGDLVNAYVQELKTKTPDISLEILMKKANAIVDDLLSHSAQDDK